MVKYVGIYHSEGINGHGFTFCFGTKKQLPKTRNDGVKKLKRVRLLAFPSFLRQEMEKAVIRYPNVRVRDKNEKNNVFGFIHYDLNLFPDKARKIAAAANYYPKAFLENVEARGLGYFLEAACVAHLKKAGVTHVSTSYGPELPRIRQLKKVGLPIQKPVEINAWLKAMAKGIQTASRRQKTP